MLDDVRRDDLIYIAETIYGEDTCEFRYCMICNDEELFVEPDGCIWCKRVHG